MSTFTLEKIEFGSKTLYLHSPLTIVVNKVSDEVYTHENKHLDILSYGETEADSLEGFKEIFHNYWETLALEEDHCLTDDAKDIKIKLKKLVKE